VPQPAAHGQRQGVHQEQPRHYEWQGDGLAHAEALSQRALVRPFRQRGDDAGRGGGGGDETGKDVVYAASSARFAFWPANKTAMPLLYIAAIIFLCNCKATSTFNESFHSVATYILRDSRRSMTNIKAEALTLMRAVLPNYLKTKYPELLAVEVTA
jgi:hypothetical protein